MAPAAGAAATTRSEGKKHRIKIDNFKTLKENRLPQNKSEIYLYQSGILPGAAARVGPPFARSVLYQSNLASVDVCTV